MMRSFAALGAVVAIGGCSFHAGPGLGDDAPVTPPVKPPPDPTWRTANLTNFTSYPEPGSEECEDFNGCSWAGHFAFVDGQQSEDWVMEHNIAAVHSRDDGWVDPYAVLMAYRKKVRSLGVTLIQDEVVGIERAGKLVRSVSLKSGDTLVASNVVNAAGAWSPIISEMVAQKLPITPLRRFEHYFECENVIEPLPYVKDVNKLAFRPEGKGYTGGVPTLHEPRGYNFETDHDYFDNVVWPALANRFPQFEKTKCKNTMPGLYDQNDLDGNPIIGPWEGECENFYLATGFSGHGLMHAPATGRAIAELILHRRFETLDLTRMGWKRVVDNAPYPEQGII